MKTVYTIEKHEHDISTTEDKLCSGCTLGKDADPVIIATFDTKPDAVAALKEYTAKVDRVNSYTAHVVEYWLHEFNAADDGEPLNDGSDEYTQCDWLPAADIIEANRDKIADEMREFYHYILTCGGRVQYKFYLWDDGEIERLEGPQGDNSYLRPRDCEDRRLFYLGTISAPFFDPWDYTDHAAPEDEDAREAEEAEIIDELCDSFDPDAIIDDAILEAKREDLLR